MTPSRHWSTKLLTTVLLIGFFVFMPLLVQAQGLVPACRVGDPNCANAYNPDNYGACELVQLANNIISFGIALSSIIMTIILVYAGYLLVTSGGNAGTIKKAKGMFTNIVIGLLILLSSFLIVNTILIMLVGGSPSAGKILQWNNIPCSYSYEAGEATRVAITLKRYMNNLDFQEFVSENINPDLITSSAGVCTSGDIGKVWGSLAGAANCIITNESACGATPVSRSDIGADGNPFSFGAMQINTTVHVIRGCGSLGIPDLDCKDAWSGKDYGAHVTNQSLYKQCVSALMNPECNMINGRRIYQEAGNSWRPWSTARGCGLN